MSLGVGTRIDRYTLLELLGEGGQGAVWKVEDPLAPGELRALKLIGLRLAGEEELERLRREARVLARLEHPSLCRCHGLFEDLTQDVLGFAMDYVAGRSLGEALSDARLSGELREQVLLHVTRALAYVHEQGAVHRDVKLANVLLEDGFWKKPADPSTVKLVDFGIAALDGVRKRLTATGFAVGTPAYMAPEQIEPGHWGADGLTPAADLFGLGVLAWKVTVGGHPTGVGREAALGDYAMAYRKVVATGMWPPKMPGRRGMRPYRRCLELHPQDRYANAGELLRKLEAQAEGGGAGAVDVTGVHVEPKEPVESFARSDVDRSNDKVTRLDRKAAPVPPGDTEPGAPQIASVMRVEGGPSAPQARPDGGRGHGAGLALFVVLVASFVTLGLWALGSFGESSASSSEALPTGAVTTGTPSSAPSGRGTATSALSGAPRMPATCDPSGARCSCCATNLDCGGDCDDRIPDAEEFELRLLVVHQKPVSGPNAVPMKGIRVKACVDTMPRQCADLSNGITSLHVTAELLNRTGVELEILRGKESIASWAAVRREPLTWAKRCESLVFNFQSGPYRTRPKFAHPDLRRIAFRLDPPGAIPPRCPGDQALLP